MEACGAPPDQDGAGVEKVVDDIINGTTVTVDNVGTPLISMSDPMLHGNCSGTLIKSDWLLTAHHCVTQGELSTGGTAIQPGELSAQILNMTQTAVGRLILRHPTLDVALVKLDRTLIPQGQSSSFPNWIYLGSDAPLAPSTTLYTQGWGVTGITSCNPLKWSGTVALRSANQLINSANNPSIFSVVPNSSGQIAFAGDSGSSLFAQVRGYERTVGVASNINCASNPVRVTQANYVRSDAFRGWLQGTVGFAPSLGQNAGYERSDGYSAVVYVDNNGHVKELSTNSGSSWHLKDFTASFGSQVVQQFGWLSPYVRTDGINAIDYVGTDGNIYEQTQNGSTWSQTNLTALLGQPAGSTPSSYVRSDNVSAVVYTGNDGQLRELRLPSGGNWVVTNLGAGIAAPMPVGQAIGYVRADGTNAIVYSTISGHIIEASISAAAHGWVWTDLTTLTNAPTTTSQVRPYTRSDTYSSVLFGTSDGHIREMFLNAAPGSTWGLGDVTASAHCPATGTVFTPYVRNDNWNAILFTGAPNGDTWEMSLAPGAAAWTCHDLTAATGAPMAVTPPVGFVGPDRSTNVIQKDSNGHIWSLSLVALNSNSWNKTDLTAIAGGP
jgi:hypothetical protein